MSYHYDWLMRQIEAISAMLAYFLTGKKPRTEMPEDAVQDMAASNPLYRALRSLLVQRKICEAENMLFCAMEDGNPGAAEAAAQFYADCNRLSDRELEDANFSREEILSGLQEVCKIYQLDIMG